MGDAVQQPNIRMTVEDFLDWDNDGGNRHELLNGRVHAMSPERLRHLECKGAVYTALKDAIRTSGAPCSVLPDGATVPTAAGSAFRPDALVRCGPQLDGDTQLFSDPLIVVEVASPSTRHIDSGIKFAGYFGLPSVRHYLLIDPDGRVLVHHRRDGEEIRSRIIASGALRLDPPGLELTIEDLFGRE